MAARNAFASVYTLAIGEAIPAGRDCYLKSDGLVYMVDDKTKPPMFTSIFGSTTVGAKIDFYSPYPSVEKEAGGSVTVGKALVNTTDGKVIVGTTEDDAWYAGIALQAGASGNLIEVLLSTGIMNDISAVTND